MKTSPIKIQGTVIHGLRRGRRLGFPTANLAVKHNLKEGIYLARVQVGQEDLRSLLFIGAAKTFGDIEKKVEVYILDFERDIAGQTLSLQVIKRIRDNKKFSSQEALIKQMEEDEKTARRYFNRI